ncbi:ferredoxin [Actinomadura sp. NTSP31]|uniref:ferredoxin n=1 Tax=Actinomadura sp. NTSP31 TaxID=1735447 RepID=UPI0035C0013C
MQPVDCRACGARVLVEKNSPPHTSVQWTAAAGAACGEIAPRVAAGEPGARIPHCGALRASIEWAVAEGLVRIENPD